MWEVLKSSKLVPRKKFVEKRNLDSILGMTKLKVRIKYPRKCQACGCIHTSEVQRRDLA